MNLISTISTLGTQWLAAKAAEDEARQNRLAIEVKLCESMPAVGDETTSKMDFGDMAIRVEYGVTRSVDSDALMKTWGNLDKHAQDAFKWKASIDTRKLRGIQELLPEVYAKLASIITVKPAKASVKVTLTEKEAA